MVESKRQLGGKSIKGASTTYTLGPVLGEGGQATVYMAKSKDEQGKTRYWAIKMFDKKVMELNIKKF